MELWFIYALISTIFAGLASFLQKVAVECKYDNTLFNTIGMTVAVVPVYAIAVTQGSVTNWPLALVFATGGGILYMFSTFTRTAGMQNIDTALFFPLYKTLGPVVITFFGFVFFQEWFTWKEFIGIGLGIFIPLLLIHKSEQSRQKNLKKGLFLIVITVILTSLSTVTSKMGSDVMSNVLLFTAVANGIGGLSGVMIFLYRQQNPKKSIVAMDSLKDKKFMLYAILAGFLNIGAFVTVLLAFQGSSIAIVYTINSFYILIPIILSIIIYKEHWNARKAFAIGLSIVALAFLG